MPMVVPAGSGRDPAPVFSCLSAGDGRAFGAGAVHRNAKKKPPKTTMDTPSLPVLVTTFTPFFSPGKLYKFHMPAIASIAMASGTHPVLGLR